MSYSDERLDQLLRASGEQWRAAEPELAPFSVATLVSQRGPARSFSFPFGAVASLAVVLLVVVALLAVYSVGPLVAPSGTSSPSPLATLTSSASLSATNPRSPAATTRPSPTSNPGYAACTAIVDNIPMVSVKSGTPTIAAAYEVTGEQMTRYFVTVLGNSDSGPFGNGSDWWHNSGKLVDMCVFDGDFEAETPGPPGHDTNAERILVVVDGSDVFPWAFCFASQTSCGIATTDPATISAPPSIGPTPSPAPTPSAIADDGCGPSDLQPFDTPGPTPPVQFGWPLPIVLMNAGDPINEHAARAILPAFSEPLAVPADLSLQLLLALPKGNSPTYVELFYAPEPIGQSETNFDFFATRGLLLSEAPTHGQTAQFIEQSMGAETFNESGRIVRVGPHDAAVVHDRELDWTAGTRTYYVYWSDGTTDYVLLASTQPAEAVDVARSLYCGSTT